jgi:hypothetical protein
MTCLYSNVATLLSSYKVFWNLDKDASVVVCSAIFRSMLSNINETVRTRNHVVIHEKESAMNRRQILSMAALDCSNSSAIAATQKINNPA